MRRVHFHRINGKKSLVGEKIGAYAVSNSKAIFNDANPYLAESLKKMIELQDIVESVTDEQLRLFKKYSAIEPSWRKKESIACDLYFPILLALSRI